MEDYSKKFAVPIKIDIGCGPWGKEGFIGIDNSEGEHQWANCEGRPIDINYDLSKGIPFADNTVAEVFASHFLEHTDLMFMLGEIYRVLKDEGKLEFIVPYANSAEGMYPGHNIFLTEKFFNNNTYFQEHFCDITYEYVPSDEWENGELQKYTNIPFDIARVHYFNVCKWFTVKCVKK